MKMINEICNFNNTAVNFDDLSRVIIW